MSALVSLKQTMSRRNNVALHMAQYCLLIAGFVFSMSFINSALVESASAPKSAPKSNFPGVAAIDAEMGGAMSPNVPVASATKPEDDAKLVATFPPYMNGALSYVAQRYKVSAEALRPIFETAHQVGQEKRIDPLLIVAIIGIESSFNPLAESAFGAQGLMQVVPRFHQDKVPEGAGSEVFFDPVANIRIGALVLQEAIERRGGLMAGLQQYARLTDGSSWYADKVMAEKARLEQAIKRRNGRQNA